MFSSTRILEIDVFDIYRRIHLVGSHNRSQSQNDHRSSSVRVDQIFDHTCRSESFIFAEIKQYNFSVGCRHSGYRTNLVHSVLRNHPSSVIDSQDFGKIIVLNQ